MRKDGTVFYADVRVTVLTYQGRPAIQAVIRDVTPRHKAEEALRRSEATYQAIFNGVNDAVFIQDPETVEVLAINRRVTELYGYGPDELDQMNDDMRRAYGEPYTIERRKQLVRQMDSGGPLTVEWLARRKDGHRFWVEASATRALVNGCERVLWAVRDISNRKAAEEALRRSEENYRALFEQNQDGVIVLADGVIVSANQAAADISGATVKDILGKTAVQLLAVDDQAAAEARYEEAMQKPEGVSGFQGRVKRVDGTVAWVEAHGSVIQWGGRPALQVLIRDITQRRRLEEELREAQKFEALGQMAGGIAHDFNNLITGILCHVGLLKAGAKADKDTLETALVIEKAARRAADLTSQLLGFARRGKHQDIPVDIKATVDTVVALISGALERRLTVEKNLSAEPTWARGDPAQMEQAILNLAVNARDAMPDGGRMTFTVSTVELDEAACAVRPGARPGTFVAIGVADTGVGMSPAVRAHIFEPFFTTKPPGKGVGMGLAMVYGIVTNHGGWVDVESEAGHGLTFTIYLPVSEGPAEGATAPKEPAAARVSARILLVDDEEVVRIAATRMLTNMGHKVVAVSGGAEAIEYYRAFGHRWDLVIIDMIMPGMDGRQCLRALRELNPDVRAILCTGGGDDGAISGALGEGDVGFVQKPYPMEKLAEAVRSALAKPVAEP